MADQFIVTDPHGVPMALTLPSGADAARCPHCGRSLVGLGGSYAGSGLLEVKDANVAGEPLEVKDASVEAL